MIKNKIKTRSEIGELCLQWKKQGLRIGFTSGAFDLMHAGHVDYLEQAKSRCDILIVALNSDDSIKKYKGSNRPLITERFRAITVAALESVDYVFIFDERRNEKNIRTIQPDYYFKAGDYSFDQLTSKSVVEELGGEVQIIPVTYDISTTQIIKNANNLTENNRYKEETPNVGFFEYKFAKSKPAIFLDRDGTINKEIGYVSDVEQFEFLPHAIDGMKKLQDMGYYLIIVTNQGGIGLGYYTKEDFYRVNLSMLKRVSEHDIKIDKIYFCPHSLAENCSCRKPNIELLLRAQQDLNIDMSNSYFIGDRETDIETGKRAGIKTILISDSKDNEALQHKPDFYAHDLLEAAALILEQERE